SGSFWIFPIGRNQIICDSRASSGSPGIRHRPGVGIQVMIYATDHLSDIAAIAEDSKAVGRLNLGVGERRIALEPIEQCVESGPNLSAVVFVVPASIAHLRTEKSAVRLI